MSMTRAAYTQARLNFLVAPFYTLHVIMTAVIFGVKNNSWPIGLGIFLVLFVLTLLPVVPILIALVFSWGWTHLGFTTFRDLGDGSLIAAVLGATVFFIISFGLLIQGITFVNDSARPLNE